ncbi:pyridoxamine 5'-phosphate oxidase family protein [Novispirillum itersonii]|uniref:pyridoxamine 5'-phosphate oxidase family protein n=1 Tax=Novispirillum itersonii TaxID=189 RepID=UPI00037A7A57|nr:pyridoxamine 5'-phosphate oxidase family protein [Novispirillum itersonii]
MTLSEIEAAGWAALQQAAADPHAGFRTVTLCSVDAAAAPQARMVVLRACDPARRTLEIHTDIRSPKWAELIADRRVTVLGYCAQTRLQLRLPGTATLHGPETPTAAAAWDRLPPWTRSTYAGGPPGDERAFAGPGQPLGAEPPADGAGRACFGVIVVQAVALDWFRLQRQDNRRARFHYGPDGALTAAAWVNP